MKISLSLWSAIGFVVTISRIRSLPRRNVGGNSDLVPSSPAQIFVKKSNFYDIYMKYIEHQEKNTYFKLESTIDGFVVSDHHHKYYFF